MELKAIEILKKIIKLLLLKIERKKQINEAIEELEALECKDKLAELEKVILDYYLGIGYQVGIGGWDFNVEIESDYKSKQLIVYFCEAKEEHYDQILKIEVKTTKEMWDKAIAHFSSRQNEVIK